MNEIIQALAVYAIPVIFAITMHESAHAYVARHFGDDTAYSRGRLSLNPLKHIDLFGTILIPALLYFSTGGAFMFGYAKPVPIDFSRMRDPKRNMLWVALAGPASNFFMALIWLTASYFIDAMHITEPFFLEMIKAGIQINLVMFALNLFPLVPLDGGRILTSILPMKQAIQFSKLEPYGFFIVLGLLYTKILYYWLVPVMLATDSILNVITSPLQFLIK
jgi:Zn-dependent protease